MLVLISGWDEKIIKIDENKRTLICYFFYKYYTIDQITVV